MTKPSVPSTGRPEMINLTGNSTVSGLLMEALAIELGTNNPQFQQIAAAHRNAPDGLLPVTFTVAGVEIPLSKGIERMWRERSDVLNRMVSEKALEMVTAARLHPLQRIFEDFEWNLKEALRNVGAEFEEDNR